MSRYILATLAAASLSGCWQSEATRDTETVTSVEREVQVQGTVSGHPVDLVVSESRQEELISHDDAKGRSGADGAAIGKAVASAIGPLITSATGGGSGLIGLLGGLGTAEGGGAAALALAAAGMAIRERRKRKSLPLATS